MTEEQQEFIASLMPMNIEARYPDYKQKLAGDANCDGVVDAADVTLLADFIIGKTIPTAVQKTNADMNGDGEITISDLTSLLKICRQQ